MILLSACSALPKQTINQQNQKTDKKQVQENQEFNLADYEKQIKNKMPDWHSKWSQEYDNFLLADFVEKAIYELEYYNTRQYTGPTSDYQTKEKPALPQEIGITSPDKNKMIRIIYGGEPDSGVDLINLKNKTIKSISKLYCGTSCIFTNGIWLDNNQFLVAGEDRYPNVQAIESNKINEAPFIFLTDLTEQNIINYEYQ